MRYARAAFDISPCAAYFTYLTQLAHFTISPLRYPNPDAHILIRTPIFSKCRAAKQSGY